MQRMQWNYQKYNTLQNAWWNPKWLPYACIGWVFLSNVNTLFDYIYHEEQQSDCQFVWFMWPCFHWSQSVGLLVLNLAGSIPSGDFQQYMKSIQDLIPWSFAMDHINYSHSLSIHLRNMTLPSTSGQTILLNDRSDRSKPLRSIIDRKANLGSIICRFFIIVKWMGLLLWNQYIIITVRLGIWDNSFIIVRMIYQGL